MNLNIDDKAAKLGRNKDIKYGTALLNFIIEDSVNKIDSQKMNGIDNTKIDSKERELIERSDFISQREIAGKYISFDGVVAEGIMYNSEGKEVIKFFREEDYSINLDGEYDWFVGSKLDEIGNFGKTETDTPIYIRFTKVVNEGVVTIERDYVYMPIGSSTWTKMSNEKFNEYQYPKTITKIPFRRIRNKADSAPDWMSIVGFIQQLDVIGNEPSVEWEYVKTQRKNFKVFGSGISSDKFDTETMAGERTQTVNGQNSKVGSSLETVISGSQSLQQIISLIVFYEDRAMKFGFQGRDIDSSGNNKHNLQVGLFNQSHSESLQRKKRQRERDYKSFFSIIANEMFGFEFNTQNIRFDISEFEKGKLFGIKLAEEDRKLKSAQAAQQTAKAEELSAKADLEKQKLNTPEKTH